MVVLLVVDVEGVAPCEGIELFVVSERRLKCLNGIVISLYRYDLFSIWLR